MTSTRLKFTLGIDLGDKNCHFAVVTGVGGEEDITVAERAVVDTTEEAFCAWFEGRPPMRIIVEVGTHARWIAQLLEGRGHEVIVCNPRALPEIYNNPKKSDFVDSECLARIGHTDSSKLQKLVDFTSRDVVSLGLVRARDLLVKARSKLVNHIRGAVKNVGGRIPACEGKRFHRFAEHIPSELVGVLMPMMNAIEAMNGQIRQYDREMKCVLEDVYPTEGARLCALFGVGPTTALYCIAVIGNPERFPSSRHVGSYLGFGLKRRQSGASDPKLGITKAGAPLLRALLVGVANDMMSSRAPDSALRDWALKRTQNASPIEKKRIKVALARKVGVLLWHLLKTGQDYLPYPNGGGPAPAPEFDMIRHAV